MRKRICFVILLIVILAATVSLPVFSAVPIGIPSGVNFFQLTETQYRVVYDQYVQGNNVASVTYYPRASVNVGGFDRQQISTNPLTMDTGNQARFNVRLDEGQGQNDVLEYINDHDVYYMSACLQFENLSTGRVEVIMADEIILTFYNHNDRTDLQMSGTDGFRKFSYTDLSTIEFRATWDGAPFQYHSVQLRAITLYQETQIYDQSGNLLTQSYVPFDVTYFEDEQSYTKSYEQGRNQGYSEGYRQGLSVGNIEGYERGYNEGVSVGGADVVQNWSAFLLTGVSGFFSFEIFPNFPLWGFLAVMIAIPLVLMFLKMFAGG